MSVQTQTAPTKLSPTEEVLNLAKQIAPESKAHEVGRVPNADEQTLSGMEGLVRPLTSLVEVRTNEVIRAVGEQLGRIGLKDASVARLVTTDHESTGVLGLPRVIPSGDRQGVVGGYLLPPFDEVHPENLELRGREAPPGKKLLITRSEANSDRLAVLQAPVGLLFKFDAPLNHVLMAPQDSNFTLGPVLWSAAAFDEAATSLSKAFARRWTGARTADEGEEMAIERAKLRSSRSGSSSARVERCTLAEFLKSFAGGDYLAGCLARVVRHELPSDSDGSDIVIENIRTTTNRTLLGAARFLTDFPQDVRLVEISRGLDGQLKPSWS